MNPYEEGGVVIAIGSAGPRSGPFDVDQAALEALITRTLRPAAPTSTSVH